MELQGMTPIDTLYEFAGYTVGLTLGKYLLWNGVILGLLLSAALLRLYYRGTREGSFTDLAVYPVYVLFMLFLSWPIEVTQTAPRMEGADFLEEPGSVPAGLAAPGRPETLRVPRILAYMSAFLGAFQRNLAGDISDTMHQAMFQWKHIAAVNAEARILGPELREDLAVYLRSCYYPALLQGSPGDPDPWKVVPFAGLPIDPALEAKFQETQLWAAETRTLGGNPGSCADLHQALKEGVSRELAAEAPHLRAQEAYDRLARRAGEAGGSAQAYRQFYRRRVLYNEIFVLGTSSAKTLRAALPEYQLFDGGRMDLKYVTSDSANRGVLLNTLIAFTKIPRAAAAVASTVSEGWSQRSMGPATYYRVSAMGPYVYGILLGLLVLAFPVAGLFATWPGGWPALLNFMKLFISIKLWPIFWAFLSGMMDYKEIFTPEDPEGFQGTFGSEGMLPALGVMYLIVPAFSFMISSLLHQAGGAFLGSLLGRGETVTLSGALGAVTGSAGAAGRMAGTLGGRTRS